MNKLNSLSSKLKNKAQSIKRRLKIVSYWDMQTWLEGQLEIIPFEFKQCTFSNFHLEFHLDIKIKIN